MKRRRLIWLVWLVITFCLYFFENNSGTRIVLAVSVITPFISAFFAILCADRVQFEISAPEFVWKGLEFDCNLKTSGSVFLSFCSPVCRVCVWNPLTAEAFESERIRVVRVKSISLNSEHCGSLVIRLTEAAVEDLFGLFRFPVAVERSNETRTMIYPVLFPVRIIQSGAPNSSRETVRMENASANGMDDSAYAGVREYVPGDPVRQIHWKLSVKTDRILIREREKEGLELIGLCFINVLSHADVDAIDNAAETLLSVSHTLLLENIPHNIYRYDHLREAIETLVVHTESDFLQMRDELLRTEVVIIDNMSFPESSLPSGKVISFEPSAGRWSFGNEAVVVEI